MKEMKLKRQKMIKQARTKHRNQLFSSNRSKLFQAYDEQSLIPMIFLLIDKDKGQGTQLSQQQYDDFLDIISQQINQERQSQKFCNQEISNAVLSRYSVDLKEFQDFVKKTQELKKADVIIKNPKMFDLIRFLFRLQIVRKSHLIILDSVLHSIQLKTKQITEKIVQIHSLSKDKQVNQHQDELHLILNLNYRILNQMVFLNLLIGEPKKQAKLNTGVNQFNARKQKCVKRQFIMPSQNQYVLSIIKKWLVKNVFLTILFDYKYMEVLKVGQSFLLKLDNLIQKYVSLLFCLIDGEGQIRIEQDILQETFSKRFPQKVVQFMLLLIYRLLIRQRPWQIQIGKQKQSSYDEFAIVNIISKMINLIQSKIGGMSGQQKIYQQLLSFLVNIFIEEPISVMKGFIQSVKQLDQQRQPYYDCFLDKLVTSSKKDSQPFIVRTFRRVQDLQYPDLVTFVQTLSVVFSYNDKAIQVLFQLPDFKGYYDQTLNFQLVLQRKLLRHFSIEIRRRAYWLLTNITGSALNYHYGLSFIKSFYIQDTLQGDYASNDLTKQELLIRQSIMQVMMNFLANVTSLGEVMQLFQFKKQTKGLDKQSKEEMLAWMLRIFGQVVKSLSQNRKIISDSQKLLQILIYSLFNILTLQRSQESVAESFLLQIFENNQIPKHLENIYQNIEQQLQESTTFCMLEKLLDLIQKVKGDL